MHKDPRYWVAGFVLVVGLLLILLWLRARQMTATDQAVGEANLRPVNYPYTRFGESIAPQDPVGDTLINFGDTLLQIKSDPISYTFNIVKRFLKSPDLNLGDINLTQVQYTLPGMQLPGITPGPGDCGCTGNPYTFARDGAMRLEF